MPLTHRTMLSVTSPCLFEQTRRSAPRNMLLSGTRSLQKIKYCVPLNNNTTRHHYTPLACFVSMHVTLSSGTNDIWTIVFSTCATHSCCDVTPCCWLWCHDPTRVAPDLLQKNKINKFQYMCHSAQIENAAIWVCLTYHTAASPPDVSEWHLNITEK